MTILSTITDAVRAKANTNSAQDADKIFANITREQYDDFVKNFQPFEDQLLARAQNDTSLIDQAKKDAPKAAQIATGVANRNASRYGIALLPDQLKAQQTTLKRQSALGASDAINGARIAQRDLNDSLMGKVIDIGSGVLSSSLGQLGSAAEGAVARRNAYTSAKAQSQANTYSTLGALGSAAILAFAF